MVMTSRMTGYHLVRRQPAVFGDLFEIERISRIVTDRNLMHSGDMRFRGRTSTFSQSGGNSRLAVRKVLR